MDSLDEVSTNQSFNPLLVLPVVLSALWVLYDVFYASYLLAFLVNTILNLYLRETGVHIGQLRLSLLTGRVIFKDVQIYRRDDCFHIVDGYGVLRWWRRPITTVEPSTCNKCLSQSCACTNKKTSLLFLQLNGFEYHWYNRSDVYDSWGQSTIDDTDSDDTSGTSWINSIQPTVHCTFNRGKLKFGNQLVESTLVVYFDHAEGHYSMTDASNAYDELMHLARVHVDKIKAVLEPSPGYIGPITPVMGCTNDTSDPDTQGYLLMTTDYIDCVYSLDMPGLVPLDDTSSPKFSLDVHIGTNAVVNYGTYANRLRTKLQKFFFPNDYTIRPVNRSPQPGEKRVYTSFDVSLFVSTPSVLNVYFQGIKDVSYMSFSVSGDNHLVVSQPWITKEDGITTAITGKLSNLVALTSLSYQPLGKAQDINISSSLHFPRVWNCTQTWNMDFAAFQSEVNILFEYIDFFNEFVDDWARSDSVDLVDFLPLNWNIGVDFENYEVYLFTNIYNWIDTSPDSIENGRLAFCGKTGHISIEMPFTDFLPNEQNIKFSALGQNIVVRRYFSPSSMSRLSAFALSSSNRDRWRIMEPPQDRSMYTHPLMRSVSQPIEQTINGSNENNLPTRSHIRRGSEPLTSLGNVKYDRKGNDNNRTDMDSSGESARTPVDERLPMGYCCNTTYDSGWLDLGCGPALSINITYAGHNSDFTHLKNDSNMVPSQVKIEVEVPSALIRVFSSLFRDLVALKYNYPGEYMYFKTFSSQDANPPESVIIEETTKGSKFDVQPDLSDGPHEPDERFVDVIVHFQMSDITGEFPTHLPEGMPKNLPLPTGHSDSFTVYVEYKRNEIIVKLNVEPVTIHLPSLGSSPNEYSLGHVALSSIQFTCHGFTEFLLKERVEYAWMMKLDVGKIAGSVSGEQMFLVVDFFYTAVSHILSHGDSTYKAPDPVLIEPVAEPLSETLKYRLFALTIDSVDVHLRENNTLLKILVPGFDLDLCNLHSSIRTLTVSFCLKQLFVSSYVSTSANSKILMECGCIDLGSIQGDIRLREPQEAAPHRQQQFLKRADASSRRLWFLWDDKYQCGCCGGCQYLNGSVQRDESPVSHQTSRYFSNYRSISNDVAMTTSSIPFPSNLSFCSLSSINYLHHLLISNYQFDCGNSLSKGFSATPGEINVDIIPIIENLSQNDSEASFYSATQSFNSQHFTDDEENYESLDNSPKVSEKQSRSQKNSRANFNNTKPFPDGNYSNSLDCYRCTIKQVSMTYTKGNQPTAKRSIDTPMTNVQSSPWYKNGRKHVPNVVLEIPHISSHSVGHLPFVIPNSSELSLSSVRSKISHYFHDKKEIDEKTLAFLSVSINVTGSFGAMVSPPALTLLNKYVSLVDKFFTTRTPHGFLDVITFDSLGAVKSHLSQINPLTQSIPSDNFSPLIHFSMSLSPSTYGSVLFLHSVPLPVSILNHRKSRIMRSSVVALYASGISCNALAYHHSVISDGNSSKSNNGNIQMTLKLAGNLQVPVLQGGLYILIDKVNSPGISPAQSLLDFMMQLPSDNSNLSAVGIAELSLNKLSSTITGKINQSELSTNPILTWTQVGSHFSEHFEPSVKDDDSELSHNSIAININVPSIRLQVGGPAHGIPAANDVCIDPAIVVTFVKEWKPLVEDVIASARQLWTNKIVRDRCLLLALITSAMKIPTLPNAVSMPLLTKVSNELRETTVCAILNQLWGGLPLATEECISSLSSVYKEGYLLQEIMAASLGLLAKLKNDDTLNVSLNQLKSQKLQLSRRPTGAQVVDYHSISPSPSLLAVPNELHCNDFPPPHITNTDYNYIINDTDYDEFVVLRESLLPFYKACNVYISPQLKKECFNKSKLAMEYLLEFQEIAVLVIDGRSTDLMQDEESLASYEVFPEFLLEQFHISGSLDYVVESVSVPSQVSTYIVTVRTKKTRKNDHLPKKRHSNVISKCSVSLGTLAMHITLPLLMVVRHTSQSMSHMRSIFDEIRQTTRNILQMDSDRQSENEDNTNVTNEALAQSMLVFTQNLVQQFICMEQRKTCRSMHTTPQSIKKIEQTVSIPQSQLSPFTDTNMQESHSLTSSPSDVPDSPINGLDEPVLVIHHPRSGQYDIIDDTTDSPQVFSSDPDAPIQASLATYPSKTAIKPSSSFDIDQSDGPESPNMRELLIIPDEQLEFSVFGSIRITTIQVSTQIESMFLVLEIQNVSGSIDCRQIPHSLSQQFVTKVLTTDTAPSHVPFIYKLLPTYLSFASNFKRTLIRAADNAISTNDLAILSSNDIKICTSMYYGPLQPSPAYRCLFKLPEIIIDVKQPPIILHKKLHKYIPTFTLIYSEVFAPSPQNTVDEQFFVGNAATPNMTDIQFPPHIPKGSVLFYLKNFHLIIRPLSSLTVTYDLKYVTAQLKSTSVIKFSMGIGNHNLEFTPKEYKDELSLRLIPLPLVLVNGSVVPQPFSRLPSITLEMAIKQIIIDVSTDVLNQLLILQTAFIKEINELFNMFFNVGESIPQEKFASINLKQSTESGFELVSLLNSVKMSMQGIKVTVSTPLATAIRFSTGNKIEMLITNPSHQPDAVALTPKNRLTLHGKVETQINVALGYLQEDTDVEEEDDFVELAYFKTWIAVRNTLQQNTSLLTGEDTIDHPVSLDTFLISIYSPHLYIQSTAVEKAILFWVNCKSVYNFWQNEHRQLNAEVQAATEAFVGRFNSFKPTTSQLKTPSIDFSKPRFVQINVNDVGACMPLIPLPTTPHSSQRGFPAIVLTIKEMVVSLNLSKRLVSAGKFTGFLIRFDEHFHFRHKTWTIDPKKHKFLNYGIIPSGTYRFCIVNKPKHEDGAEKLFSAFTWHMSGININVSTDIGRHISTLVRTLTTIGSDLEELDTQGTVTPPLLNHSPVIGRSAHKRPLSYAGKSHLDDEAYLRAMEWDLAKQTRKLQKLKQIGVAPDSLKYEEDTFHKLELDLVRGLRRVFRKGRGMTFQQITQILSPRSSVMPSSVRRRLIPTAATLPRKRLQVSFEESSIKENHGASISLSKSPLAPQHTRHRSDISPDVMRMIQMEEGETVSSATGLKEQILTSSGSLEAVEEEDTQHETPPKCISDHKHSDPLIPSINIEFNVTVNVDSGSIILHSEDLISHEHEHVASVTKLQNESPLPSLRREKSKSTIDTILHIPALEVKAHYQSIVGKTYSNSRSSPSKSESVDSSPATPSRGSQSDFFDKSGNPIKKGIFTILAVVAPLPQDIELNPSVLDFVEQVVRPINISTQNNDLPDSDDEQYEGAADTEKESSVAKPVGSSRPLSFPVDVCITFTIHPSKIYLNCSPHARVKCLIEIPTVNFLISFSLFTRKQLELNNAVDISLSTVVLEEDIATFNNLNVTGCFKTFALVMYTPQVQSASSPLSSLSQSDDKEAFHLVLGQAFVHMSRMSVHCHDNKHNHNKTKVSVLPVIESLILQYDWRRLNDITWFRKCWYHKGLVEALFIGRNTVDVAASQRVSPFDPHSVSPTSGTGSPKDVKEVGISSNSITAEIVIAANVVDLRLFANVAQFMGNAHVILSHLQGHAHCDIKDNELALFVCDCGIEKMELNAQGGVVAGDIAITHSALHVTLSSQSDDIPKHNAECSIVLIQGHIDYMSAQIMLLRATEILIKVWDTWEGIMHSAESQPIAPSIQICCSLSWSTFQLAIHRSTAKAMFGILQRMYDFVIQQKKRSERTIGLMLPAGTFASTAFAAYQKEQKRAEKSRAAEIENPMLERHHWVWAVRVGSIQLMNAIGIDVSQNQHDVSLGGSIKVSGNNICLVCFHGTSFRETEWAAINIDLINAQFSTLAIPGLGATVNNPDEATMNDRTRICSQICKILLGDEKSKFKELAAVYRVSCGRAGVPPIEQKEISQWLNYACIDFYLHPNSNVDDSSPYFKQSQKLSIQPIIGLPAFEATLINDHFWPPLHILLNQDLSTLQDCATVECSVLSKFHEGISITTTVENYLFLHDLFKSYVDHLETHKISFRPPFTAVSQTPFQMTSDVEYDDKPSMCLRRFVNIHWELDPHLHVMAKSQWASGQFNPHINWLLEKLGFEHARTTIPKSIQRGLMDPLDLGIASLLELLINFSGKKQFRMTLATSTN